MSKEILLGDEAVALAALDAGITASYSYPGTPATEVHEHVRQQAARYGLKPPQWSVNEKVAYEEAVGCSHSGRRSLVVMKHVGLNVAADPFVNSALTGARGGLVVCVADDPSMHSSQNEQDTRYLAAFAQLPCLEPADQQAAYDLTREAFELSERLELPVVLRLVTRLAHSRAAVQVGQRVARTGLGVARNDADWTLLPVNARRRYQRLVELQPRLQEWSDASAHNTLTLRGDRGGRGVIATGIARNYVLENLADLPADQQPSLLHIQTYPFPRAKVRQLLAHCDELLFVEDGYPFVERAVTGLDGIPGKALRGRSSGALPPFGELSPTNVRAALGLAAAPQSAVVDPDGLPRRPPALCPGCPHIDTFNALNEAIKRFPDGKVYSDIGCYTLGAYPPYEAIGSCLCMGASVSMAKGAADGGVQPAVAVIGDSTFAHSGLTPLLSAVADNAPITVMILDNGTVAMTGGQQTAASDERLVEMVAGLGVPREHIRVLTPLAKHHAHNVAVIAEELAHPGPSVVIPCRGCVQVKPPQRSER